MPGEPLVFLAETFFLVGTAGVRARNVGVGLAEVDLDALANSSPPGGYPQALTAAE